jgi:four helix bundle protein
MRSEKLCVDAGEIRMVNIRSHRDPKVWQEAMDADAEIIEISKCFPQEEKYSLTDQIGRSSRSVAANIAEAWRKRRYEAAFKSKLNDSEAEACETQTWIAIALRCGYLNTNTASQLDQKYEHTLGRLVVMIRDSKNWTLRKQADT